MENGQTFRVTSAAVSRTPRPSMLAGRGPADEDRMRKGAVTISIDLELAWGVWDILTPADLALAEAAERPICAALLELFDRHQVAATWALVAALLDRKSAEARPGSPACWHAPDIVERIVRASAGHEIGSHGGRHIYFADIASAEARDDLAFAADQHRANGLPFTSFVFPRNAVGHLDALAEAGLRTFRGPDVGWTGAARRAGRRIGQAVNLADKMLPIPPSAVTASRRGGLIDIPGSMLLLGRNGPRRFVLPAVTRAKLHLGLERAQRTGATFHLWFHPSNFYFRRAEQLDTLAWFLARAADAAGRGQIEIRTMGAYARAADGADAQAAE
jgi:peptidoglycan/xylan/chitin deacetylase (PgdA/CDA1 family)